MGLLYLITFLLLCTVLHKIAVSKKLKKFHYKNFTILQAVMYTTYCYFFHVLHANWPTITGRVLCHGKVGRPSLKGSVNLKLSTWSVV
jgi:hypothetical protein